MGLIKKKIIIVSTLNLNELITNSSYHNLNFRFINNENDLLNHFYQLLDKPILITYNTNIIIKQDILNSCTSAYNVHAASPEFPGRDPHHWAIYRKAKTYGATLHVIDKFVDSGAIIKVKTFDVKFEDNPQSLLEKANNNALELLNWLLDQLDNQKSIPINTNLKWNNIKTKRIDLLEICNLTNITDKDEVELRIKAFYSQKFPNLFIKKFNQKFYLFDK
jgi:methionyl-tRNA formyltransferase